ncbi:TcaA NTF2-like domain-containing protein [Aminipila terrae]|uniref:TcaA protein NTF2-like domain-containing protein n=1 Tax=Aminipila terrae TaxID=2697030 RepID=A0A6P1MEW9_9FIRM|nr:hypothetical protein [Aminipila terrae]QHI72361.1 hypothetical protein Ami3637_08060 [Aminipila terrae]
MDRPAGAHWNLEGFPLSGDEHKKTEDIKVDWGKRELLKFDTESGPIQEEDIKQSPIEIRLNPEIKPENKTDIFEVFDQQLKEAGNEGTKNKDTLIFEREPLEILKQKEPEIKAESTLEQELFKPRINKNDKVHTPVEEQIDKFYTFSKKNEEFQKLLDKEYERLKKTPDAAYTEPPQIPSNIEKLNINMPASMSLDQTDRQVNENLPEDDQDKTEKEELVKEEPKEKSPQNNLSEEKVESFQGEIVENSSQDQDENEVDKPAILPWDEMESPLGDFVDEDAGKKVSPVAVILAIIIALLLFEVTILGIKYFLPESSAASFINNKLSVAVNWADHLKSNKDQKEPADQSQKDKKEDAKAVNAPAQPDKAPSSDKEALIAESLGYNKNIKSVKADDSLIYIDNKDYGDKNINNSQQIENNIWYQDDKGNTVFYDKEIVKAIIQFDSSWIDYVNNKDQTVLGFAKEGSPAYKAVKNSSKAGKVTETFDTLRIGDIRQGGNGFYLWVYEEITITENGKAKTKNYDYIYYLEPVEKQMKIVSYTEI